MENNYNNSYTNITYVNLIYKHYYQKKNKNKTLPKITKNRVKTK